MPHKGMDNDRLNYRKRLFIFVSLWKTACFSMRNRLFFIEKQLYRKTYWSFIIIRKAIPCQNQRWLFLTFF